MGDFLIWKEVLSLNEDVTIVTNEKKMDWYQEPNQTPEILIEEFKIKTNKCSFSVISFDKFVLKYMPDLSFDAKAEVRKCLAIVKHITQIDNGKIYNSIKNHI